MGTYREGFAANTLEPAGLYLRTNTGHLYMSADEGDHWRALTTDLARPSPRSASPCSSN